jgi:hypothetical protein
MKSFISVLLTVTVLAVTGLCAQDAFIKEFTGAAETALAPDTVNVAINLGWAFRSNK